MDLNKIFCCSLLLMLPGFAVSEADINYPRAKFHYQMHCQGCHVGTGQGGKSVPDLRNYMGNFLTLAEGREYLVRVPGSANSTLNSEHLAELLNWMLVTFAGDSLPQAWQPYKTDEVEQLRQFPFFEVVETRKQLVEKIGENSQTEYKDKGNHED